MGFIYLSMNSHPESKATSSKVLFRWIRQSDPKLVPKVVVAMEQWIKHIQLPLTGVPETYFIVAPAACDL